MENKFFCFIFVAALREGPMPLASWLVITWGIYYLLFICSDFEGADIDQGDDDLVTPLCGATAANSLPVVNLLLNKGCDISKLADYRPLQYITTPLQYAILNNNVPIVKLLLQAGHDPNFPSNHCKFPLIEAIALNCPEIVKLFLNCTQCKVNYINSTLGISVSPPLHQALFTYRRYDIAKILLDSKRCSLTYHDGSYLSMLMYKAFDRTFMKLKMAKMLLEAGCDMECHDRKGQLPFTTLIQGNDYIFNITSMMQLMKLMVNHGVWPSIEEVEYLRHYIQCEDEANFVTSLQQLTSKPRTLQEFCRKFFRERFGIFPKDKLQQLPLPATLVCYLTLEGVKCYYDIK